MTLSAKFGIYVADLPAPDARPMLTETTLLDAFELFSRAGRAAAAHSLPVFTRENNAQAFRVQSDLYGRALAFANLLASNDRMSPLRFEDPASMPPLEHSARGLISLLLKWLEQLPPLPMNEETQEAFFLAVTMCWQKQGRDTTKLNQELGRLTGLVADLASRTGLTEEACLDRIIKVSEGVMPTWREWLGGIEPTRLPYI